MDGGWGGATGSLIAWAGFVTKGDFEPLILLPPAPQYQDHKTFITKLQLACVYDAGNQAWGLVHVKPRVEI